MRYLKLFENESYTITKRIDYFEFLKILDDNILNKLSSFFKDSLLMYQNKTSFVSHPKSTFFCKKISPIGCNYDYILIQNFYIDFYIYRLSDDYYYVQFFDSKGNCSYYKCDQLSGLKKCIKKEVIK